MSRKSASEPAEGSPSIERLLEAISPALSQELDRVMQEFRASLEIEFDIRVKRALIEKQAEFRGRAEELRRTTEAETREAVQSEIARELRTRFKADHDRELAELKSRLETEARQTTDRLRADHSKAVGNERTSVREKVTKELEARFKPDLEKQLKELGERLEEEARQATTRLKGQHAQAIAKERESVRENVTADLENEFKMELRTELSQLESRLKADTHRAGSQWKLERTELIDQAEKWRLLAEFQRRLGDASSQVQILSRFLNASERFCAGVALYLNKPDGLELWKRKGEAAVFPELISPETIDPEWYFTPVVIRSKTVAAICAAGIEDRESLVMLVDVLKKTVESFGLRLRFFGSGAMSEPGTEDNSILDDTSSTRSRADEANVRDEARRLARTLVSEIKLGHEDAVVEGRVHSDLYARLQKEIDEGHEIYKRQVTVVGGDQDYFHEQVIKILAEDDPERLGAAYPGKNP